MLTGGGRTLRLPTPLLGLSSSSALRSSLATAVSCSCSTVRSSSLITNLPGVREAVEREDEGGEGGEGRR